MTTTFKPGDRVVCVDDHDCGQPRQLTNGLEYTVTYAGSEHIKVSGAEGLWFPSRFRLAQPSPEPAFYGTMPEELPETLPAGTRVRPDHSDGAAVALGQVTLSVDNYRGDWEVHGKRHDNIFYMAENIDWSTVRRLPAPSADKWQPSVGDEVEWIKIGGTRYEGRGTWAGSDQVHGQHGLVRLLPGVLATLRPATTPAPSEGTGGQVVVGDDEWDCLACGAKCGAHPDQCGICGTVRGHTKMRAPAPKLDPDGYLNREALDERRRGERLDFGARRLAAVQAHKLDLDRKIPTVRGRLAAEVKAALRVWPEAEED